MVTIVNNRFFSFLSPSKIILNIFVYSVHPLARSLLIYIDPKYIQIGLDSNIASMELLRELTNNQFGEIKN